MSTSLDLPPTLAGLNHALKRGDFTIDEALAEQRRRCIANDRDLCALVHLTPARSPARDTQARDAHAQPLAGAALAHKDIFDFAGRKPTCGAPRNVTALREPGSNRPDPAQIAVPRPDAAVLKALARAGASYAGALSLAQFACGSTAENPALPRPVNPLDARAMVGGSSSGSAVAVAGDLCYASLGTDTAGSVRIPAATCGLIGLKTTSGYLSTAGVAPLAPSLDTVGVIARDALDAALVLRCSATAEGAAPPDLATLDQLLASRPLRIAISIDDPLIDAQVGAALNALVSHIGSHHPAGVVTLDPGAPFDEWSRRAQIMLHAEAARIHLARLRIRADHPLPAPLAGVLTPGVALPDAWYRRACAQRPQALNEAMRVLFRDADVILTPALPTRVPDWETVHTHAARFSARALFALHRHTAWVNYLGLPAIVFPIARDSAGRPICAQLVGRPFAELSLLALVRQFERDGITAITTRRPFSPPSPDSEPESGFRTSHA
jgi:Asp-tRNA(Asn)/Glu-tRNA(Gln) amidotransferase A subunit family amidase